MYRLHGTALLAYLRARTFDRHVAEDLLQETFLRAWRTPGIADDPPEKCRAWLVTVARNLAIDWLRGRARRPREIRDYPMAELPRPGCDADRTTTTLTLRGAMAKLTPIQREIIGQVFVMERSQAEVAATLGVPFGTVKSRQNAAVSALRRQLCR